MRFRVAREPSSLLSFFATVWLTGSEEQGRKEIGIIDCETFTRGMFSNYLVRFKKKKKEKNYACLTLPESIVTRD